MGLNNQLCPPGGRRSANTTKNNKQRHRRRHSPWIWLKAEETTRERERETPKSVSYTWHGVIGLLVWLLYVRFEIWPAWREMDHLNLQLPHIPLFFNLSSSTKVDLNYVWIHFFFWKSENKEHKKHEKKKNWRDPVPAWRGHLFLVVGCERFSPAVDSDGNFWDLM